MTDEFVPDIHAVVTGKGEAWQLKDNKITGEITLLDSKDKRLFSNREILFNGAYEENKLHINLIGKINNKCKFTMEI